MKKKPNYGDVLGPSKHLKRAIYKNIYNFYQPRGFTNQFCK